MGADAGSAEAVELLLRRGADVNQDAVVERPRFTPSQWAVDRGAATTGVSKNG